MEQLEDRQLPSGLTSPLSAHPPTPSGNGPALLAHPQPDGAAKHSQAPIHPPQDLTIAGPIQDGGGSRASSPHRVDAGHDAQGPNQTDSLADPAPKDETKPPEHHPASDHHPSSPPAADAGQAHRDGGHKAGESGEPHAVPASHGHTTTEDDGSGRVSGASDRDSDSRADRSADTSERRAGTDLPAEETTTAEHAAHAASLRGSVGTALTVAVHSLLAQASPARSSQVGPVVGPEETPAEGPFQVVREEHDAQGDHTDPAIAVPAREAAAAEAFALAFAAQTGTSAALTPGGAVNVDRQAAGLNLMFLVPESARPGAWLWGASTDWLGFAVVGDEDAPQVEAIRPAVAARPSNQPGATAEATNALPEGAGLAAGFLPADTTALEQAVRRFLSGLDTLGREVTRVLTENTWARWVVITAVIILAAVLGRRRIQRSSRQGAAAEEHESATLSWLAGSYPFRPEDV
jgi:hypothetical protein